MAVEVPARLLRATSPHGWMEIGRLACAQSSAAGSASSVPGGGAYMAALQQLQGSCRATSVLQVGSLVLQSPGIRMPAAQACVVRLAMTVDATPTDGPWCRAATLRCLARARAAPRAPRPGARAPRVHAFRFTAGTVYSSNSL